MAKLPKGGGAMRFTTKLGLWAVLIALAIGLLAGGASWFDYLTAPTETPITTTPEEQPAEG